MEENKAVDFKLTPDLFEPLPETEKNAEKIAYESSTYLQDAWRRFKKNKLALMGLVFLTIMIVLCIVVPMVSPYTYDGQDMSIQHANPSMQHLLGTDKFGRDTLVRVMFGGRISIAIGFAAAFISLVVGVIYGAISGYCGGKVDMVMMRIVDAMYSIPDMLYVIMIVVAMGASIPSIMIGVCLTFWMDMARQVRSQVLTLKEQEFSLAAFVLGASRSRILFKHLVINSMGPIIVTVTMLVPRAIFYEAFLAFLGIGIPDPMASWGTLANDAKGLVSVYPLEVIWPVLAICLTMLSLNFIGDGMGDALDPKKK